MQPRISNVKYGVMVKDSEYKTLEITLVTLKLANETSRQIRHAVPASLPQEHCISQVNLTTCHRTNPNIDNQTL